MPSPLVLRIVAAALAAATALASMAVDGSTAELAVLAAVIAAGTLVAPGRSEASYAIGLGVVLVPVVTAIGSTGADVGAIVLAAGVAATAEATGLARRATTRARVGPEVARAELLGAATVVGLTVAGGIAVVLVGRLPGPGGLLGEVVGLAALVGLGALIAVSPSGRAALRSLLHR